MFVFGFKGFKKGVNNSINDNGNKVLFLDYILFIANILIILTLLTCLVLKCYDVFIKHSDVTKNILYLEIVQFITFIMTVFLSVAYCIKKTKKSIIICRCLFLSNILFNIVILFAFDLLSKLNFKVYYYEIINNVINLVVIIIIAIDCIIYHIKTTRENSKYLKK